jgi:hypothetical protein
MLLVPHLPDWGVMSKKQNRRARRSQQNQQPSAARAVRKQFLNTPSLIFIGVIALMVAIVAAIQVFGNDDVPECPPGQVWSDSHGHCH